MSPSSYSIFSFFNLPLEFIIRRNFELIQGLRSRFFLYLVLLLLCHRKIRQRVAVFSEFVICHNYSINRKFYQKMLGEMLRASVVSLRKFNCFFCSVVAVKDGTLIYTQSEFCRQPELF